jgi:hypothetical protein
VQKKKKKKENFEQNFTESIVNFQDLEYGPEIQQERLSRDTLKRWVSIDTRLCIGPYMVTNRMPIYRENPKEAEYATAEQRELTRVLYAYPLCLTLFSSFFFYSHTPV